MNDQNEGSVSAPIENSDDSKSLIRIIKKEIPDETATIACEKIPDEERQTSKRKLSSNGSSEDDEAKVLKLEGDSVDETDQVVTDDNDLSCNEDEDSSHTDDSDDSADDPQVLEDILSVKKMELLQHPQVIAFIQEKMDQAKKAKGK